MLIQSFFLVFYVACVNAESLICEWTVWIDKMRTSMRILTENTDTEFSWEIARCTTQRHRKRLLDRFAVDSFGTTCSDSTLRAWYPKSCSAGFGCLHLLESVPSLWLILLLFFLLPRVRFATFTLCSSSPFQEELDLRCSGTDINNSTRRHRSSRWLSLFVETKRWRVILSSISIVDCVRRLK